MVDIVPELLSNIQNDFNAALSKSNKIAAIRKAMADGVATYADANEYAQEVGLILAQSFKKYITPETLPDGRMYYNIADRILTQTLENNHNLISVASSEIQTQLNAAAGIGIKGIKAAPNKDRIIGLVNRVSSEVEFEKIAWILDEPVINFSQAVVDESIKSNAEFHYSSGLSAKIVRTPESGACKWCREVAGTYAYPDVPEDVYRRHDRCRCIVNFESSKGKTAIHKGTEGKRKYVQDKYGNYEKTREERIKYAKELEETAKERAAAARQKRIDAWKQKKLRGS